MFNTIAALVVPIGIASKKVKSEIELHLLTAESKTRKFLM